MNNKAARTAPTRGAIAGLQAYAQSEVPLCLSGKSICTRRGPKSRAGLTAKPVVEPKDKPKDMIITAIKPVLTPEGSSLCPTANTARTRSAVPYHFYILKIF